MPGFIRGEADLKILLLYVLARLPEPVTLETMSEVCELDGNVTYFAVAHCLSELAETEHVTLERGHYSVTERGVRDGATMQNDLAYSVRLRAEEFCAAYRERAELRQSVRTEREVLRRGGFAVDMQLTDNGAELLRLRMFAPGEDLAEQMERRFQKHAPEIYSDILAILMRTDND